MQESSFSLSGVQMTRNYVSAIIEGSGIYSYDTYSGQKQQIGVTNECYTQLQNTAREATDKAEEYYNKLVEVGVIVPPKTPEQTIAELTAMIGELRNEIREMKENKVEVTRNESPKYSESIGAKDIAIELQCSETSSVFCAGLCSLWDSDSRWLLQLIFEVPLMRD